MAGELEHCDAGALVHHARGHDFSRWIGDVFRDRVLARSVAEVERAISSATNGDGGRAALLLALERNELPPSVDGGSS